MGFDPVAWITGFYAFHDALSTEVTPSGSYALTDLTDTDISSPASGEFLGYDGEAWINANIPNAGEYLPLDGSAPMIGAISFNTPLGGVVASSGDNLGITMGDDAGVTGLLFYNQTGEPVGILFSTGMLWMPMISATQQLQIGGQDLMENPTSIVVADGNGYIGTDGELTYADQSLSAPQGSFTYIHSINFEHDEPNLLPFVSTFDTGELSHAYDNNHLFAGYDANLNWGTYYFDTLVIGSGGGGWESYLSLPYLSSGMLLVEYDEELTGGVDMVVHSTLSAPAHVADVEGSGSSAQFGNFVFGTGDPPDANSVPEGTLFIKYIVDIP